MRNAGTRSRPLAARLETLTEKLDALAEHYDTHSCWPQRSIDILAEAGGWGWVIPRKWGGTGFGGVELLKAYEAAARGCVATALILTQRDGACELIARSGNERLKKRLLPAYARAERFTSIGIAQLTTSRSGRKPALLAKRSGKDYVLDGVIPWVTGAEQCDEIVTGAVLADGRQIIACISCEDPGVTIEPALKLMALGASCTSRVRCQAVRVTAADIIDGPGEITLSMRAPVKPLVVSAVGIGLAGALHDRLVEDHTPSELKAPIRPLIETYDQLRDELYRLAAKVEKRPANEEAAALRISVNALLAQLGMAYLMVSKGTGYARPHAAERLMREATFFLVWSAPTDVQVGTLRTLVRG